MGAGGAHGSRLRSRPGRALAAAHPCPGARALTAPPVPAAGRAPGDLFIRSLTEAHAGVYQCRVTNRVGYSVCQLTLSPSASECRLDGAGGSTGTGTGTHGAALSGCWGRGDQWQPARRPAVTGCARTVGGRQAGIIVGSILGSLLLLSLPALLIWALICRYRRKECQRACSDCR